MKKILIALVLVSSLTYGPSKPKPKAKSETVYVCGEYGARYHASSTCRGMNRCKSNPSPISKSNAINSGYTPCRIEY